MFNYRRDSRKKIKIIKNYVRKLSKCRKKGIELNKLNEFILDKCVIKNIVKTKYFPTKIYEELFKLVVDNNYRINESNVISFFNEYKLINKYRILYSEIEIVDELIFYILILKLFEIIDMTKSNFIKYSSRKNVQIHNIIITMYELYNWDIDRILLESNDCDKALIQIDEYYNLDVETRNKYRKIIKLESKKVNKSEYRYTKELIRKYRNSTKNICDYLFKRINYKLINIIVIIMSTIISLFISQRLIKLFSNKMIYLVFIVINYQSIYCIISKLIPIEFVPKNNLGNNLGNNKVMVCKYVILKDSNEVKDQFRILESMYLGNKSENIDFTLLIECTKSDHQIEPFDEEILRESFEQCNLLNKKHFREIFFVTYRKRIFYNGIWCGYNDRVGALSDFNKLLLNKLTKEDEYNLFIGHSKYKNNYNYIASIDDSINKIDIKSLMNILTHPYNKPVIKNQKILYGYGSASLDGQNLYGECFNSYNFIYDLNLYNKLLDNVPNSISYTNLLRSHSIDYIKSNKSNIYEEIKNNLSIFKYCLNKSTYFNLVFKINYFHKIYNIVVNIFSLILLLYLLFTKQHILWLLYLYIVTPNFINLPITLYCQIQIFFKILYNRNVTNTNKKYLYIINYIFCLLLILLYIIFKLDIISIGILVILFSISPIIDIILSHIRKDNYYDKI